MKKLLTFTATLATYLGSMSIASAAVPPFNSQSATLSSIIDYAIAVIRNLVPLLFGVALVIFLWGVVRFIASADNADKRKEGLNFIVYGIIGLAVMVGVWGLVAFVTNTFGISNTLPLLPSAGYPR